MWVVTEEYATFFDGTILHVFDDENQAQGWYQRRVEAMLNEPLSDTHRVMFCKVVDQQTR
jgi:hypothetical protein